MGRATTRKLPRFYQVDLESLRFQQLEERNPVDAGGFQSDRPHPARLQPRDDLLEIGGVGAELADRVGVAVGGDADHMHVGMNIDSGRVRVDDIERRRRDGDGDGKRPLTRLGWLGWLVEPFVWNDHGCLRSVDAGGETTSAASQEGYRGRWKSPQRDQYHAGKTRRGKSPMTSSKPLGPSSTSGKKHQREYGH